MTDSSGTPSSVDGTAVLDALTASNATQASQAAQQHPTQALISQPPDGNAADFGWGSYFQGVGVIFFLLAALAVVIFLLKRFGPRAGLPGFKRGNLQIDSQLSLGPKKSVVVVRFLNKSLVLGVTDTNINLLTEVEADHEPIEDTDFSETLEKERSLSDST